MIKGLDKQIQQYQIEFQKFLKEISDGTYDGKLDKIQEGFDGLSNTLKKDLMSQIQSYKNSSTSNSVGGFINFIGKNAANSLLGPVGLSYQDFQNPRRLVDKAKKTALQNVQGAISSTVKNPSISILRRIQGKGRDESINDKMAQHQSYQDRINAREMLQNPNYTPETYEEQIRKDFPEQYNRIKVIQNNNGTNFYSTYKILHEENDSELTDGLSEHLIKFHITNSDEILIFRMANFNGMTDAFTITYNDIKYFGRAEALKQYIGVSRNISFTFDIVVDNENDIYPIYKKLDILAGLGYPNSYTNDDIIQPNIIKLSLGKYLTRMPFFPTSITYVGSDELVFADGKPRLITISINGDIIQPDSNPQLNRYKQYNSFVNTNEQRPAQYDRKNISTINDRSNNNNFG